jgi:hypothetical protein
MSRAAGTLVELGAPGRDGTVDCVNCVLSLIWINGVRRKQRACSRLGTVGKPLAPLVKCREDFPSTSTGAHLLSLILPLVEQAR